MSSIAPSPPIETIGGQSERVVGKGGTSSASISVYGSAVAFSRQGSVYYWKRGSRAKEIMDRGDLVPDDVEPVHRVGAVLRVMGEEE